MSSLKADFNELLERIDRGRDFTRTGFEPVYYLVFSPSDILNVKRQIAAWRAKLKNAGWDVTVFSMADAVTDILTSARVRKFWLEADRKAPLDWDRTNTALSEALKSNDILQSKLEAAIDAAKSASNGIVLATDLEAIHPYIRIGAIEASMQGKFSVPTVFLYPGVRTGQTRLKFLGFYQEDGNYRSVHVGG
jgi:hypothetical protein